ncbi:hypothetical protein C6P42_004899 [Pichia californica]|nr:hypothetical protein C6P42_004899 [[Candida] californica]
MLDTSKSTINPSMSTSASTSLILPNINIPICSSPPILSETCVYSMPSSSSISSQNTFISDHSLSTVNKSSFNLNSLHKGRNSSDLLSHKYSSPSLRTAVLSKKCSLYKARKSSSKDLTSLVLPSSTSTIPHFFSSGPLPSSSSSSSTSSSLSSSHFSPLNDNFLTSPSGIECSSCLSYSSSLVSDLDNDSLYSNQVSSSISTIYEINDDDHPLSKQYNDNDILLQEQTFIIDETESIKLQNETDLISILSSFKESIWKSSLKLSSKLLFTTTKTNEKFINNSINLINIQNKDIILHDNLLPLETFHTSYKEIDDDFELENHSIPSELIFRCRECRINPIFLKFFAINSTIKVKYLNQLLDNKTLDYYQYEFMNSNSNSLDEFLNNFPNDSNNSIKDLKTSIKYSILSRDKMYSKVFLPPRNDLILKNKRNSPQNNYIKVKDEAIHNGTSLVRENSKVMPWFKLNDCGLRNKICFNPSGTLSNNIQYTVKNWENKRWASINMEN